MWTLIAVMLIILVFWVWDRYMERRRRNRLIAGLDASIERRLKKGD